MNQVYRLKLRVSPPGEPAFDVEISDQPLGVPEIGMTVPVLFDPKHHSKVVLDLDAMNPFAARRSVTGEVSGPPAGMAASIMETVKDAVATPDRPKQVFHLDPDTSGQGSSSGGFAGRLAAASGASASQSAPDPLDQLAKLADLHDRGVVTDAEFEAEKRRLLGEGD